MITVSLIADVAIAILLVVTICYAAVLNRRLRTLREGEGDLRSVIAEFGEATDKAGANLERMKQQATVGGAALTDHKALDQRIDRARAVTDDLTFLMDRGDELADRLANLLASARGKGKVSPVGREPSSSNGRGMEPKQNPPGNRPVARTEVERELLAALKAARVEAAGG